MKDFLNFKKMLIPDFIPVLFRISIYTCLIFGVFQIVINVRFLSGFSAWQYGFFTGFFWFILYPILLRIICEVLIILSDMNDTLTDIKKQLNPQQEPDD